MIRREGAHPYCTRYTRSHVSYALPALTNCAPAFSLSLLSLSHPL